MRDFKDYRGSEDGVIGSKLAVFAGLLCILSSALMALFKVDAAMFMASTKRTSSSSGALRSGRECSVSSHAYIRGS